MAIGIGLDNKTQLLLLFIVVSTRPAVELLIGVSAYARYKNSCSTLIWLKAKAKRKKHTFFISDFEVYTKKTVVQGLNQRVNCKNILVLGCIKYDFLKSTCQKRVVIARILQSCTTSICFAVFFYYWKTRVHEFDLRVNVVGKKDQIQKIVLSSRRDALYKLAVKTVRGQWLNWFKFCRHKIEKRLFS